MRVIAYADRRHTAICEVNRDVPIGSVQWPYGTDPATITLIAFTPAVLCDRATVLDNGDAAAG